MEERDNERFLGNSKSHADTNNLKYIERENYDQYDKYNRYDRYERNNRQDRQETYEKSEKRDINREVRGDEIEKRDDRPERKIRNRYEQDRRYDKQDHPEDFNFDMRNSKGKLASIYNIEITKSKKPDIIDPEQESSFEIYEKLLNLTFKPSPQHAYQDENNRFTKTERQVERVERPTERLTDRPTEKPNERQTEKPTQTERPNLKSPNPIKLTYGTKNQNQIFNEVDISLLTLGKPLHIWI